MGLKAIVDSLDEVDEKYRDLYLERDGRWTLAPIEGMATQADVDRLKVGITKEREKTAAAKQELSDWQALGDDLESVQATLDRVPELELAAEGKVDQSKMDELVETRLRTRLAPVERERDRLQTQLTEATETITGFETKERTRTIQDAVRKAATEGKLLPTAVDDAMLLAQQVLEVTDDGTVVTKDNVGVTPGVDPSVWLTELKDARPHWWPPSQGGGGKPGGGAGPGSNPFSHDGWNLTEQGALVRADMAKAEQLAKSAGTTVGGPRPTAPGKAA